MNRRIAVIGSGRIGRAWAIVFARAGFEVRLHDAERAMLDRAIPSIRRSVLDLGKYGLIDEPEEQIVSRVTTFSSSAATAITGLIVEQGIYPEENASF